MVQIVGRWSCPLAAVTATKLRPFCLPQTVVMSYRVRCRWSRKVCLPPVPSWGSRLFDALDGGPSAAVAGSNVQTGFADLDNVTGGLKPGDLWVISGRSGVGKSILGRDLLRSCALRQRAACLLISRREGPAEVAPLLLAAEARVPLHHLANGAVSDAERARLAEARSSVEAAPMFLSKGATEAVSLFDGRAADVARIQQASCALVVLDDVPSGTDQHVALSVVRDTARSRGCAVVAIVQEDLDAPDLQQRRLEQLADVALRLRRPDQDDLATTREGEADFVVTRNRRGPVATVVVAFQGHYGRFADLAAATGSTSRP